ncbi:hypothetical protein HBA54_02480 [Pelagibius litoralis]|uniref:Uncharacterized protein n=1 Tax=Pelagibius litoralis TaxID=374515 RepID=A0A967C2Z2_9PROT|nr:hypothetical protein [Pelagibius litoralis]NIA67449.1 hypothetical protein [Pelagibius litoralis]
MRRFAVMLGLVLATGACAGGEMVSGTLPSGDAACQVDRAGLCDARENVLIAMASGRAIAQDAVVEEEVLEEQRGGFISVGGFQVDFGFEFSTMVNGSSQLTTVLTLNDIISGNGIVPNLNSISVSNGAAGGTDIIHAAGPDGISATILNSQDGVQIENVSTLAIDIIGLRNVRKGGRALGNGRRMPMETQQSIIRSLAR